ncbi:MAG: hypothetical protein ACRCZA_15065, partial [Shewanella sp.]|uniref:hypothetical protein n=1 Tax=Shewanella sp. TaxID=50422 RepID=UPI003F33CC04
MLSITAGVITYPINCLTLYILTVFYYVVSWWRCGRTVVELALSHVIAAGAGSLPMMFVLL